MSVSPDAFTSYLQQANLEFYNSEYQKFEATQRISDSFRPFKTNDDLTVAASSATLPTDLMHIISPLYYSNVKVDYCTLGEYLERKSDELTKPSVSYPVAYVEGSTAMKFDGVTSGTVTLWYLSKPTTPFFDYYIDTDYSIKYLAVGATGYILQPGQTYRTGLTSGAISSQSVELMWSDYDKIKIVHLILGYLGVQMDLQGAYQHAGVKEQKDAQQ
jgi:hypothetical protein